MNTPLRHAIAVFALMLAAAAAAWAISPRNKLVDVHGKLDLDAAVPKAFGDWIVDTSVYGGVVNPQTEEMLKQLYSQTLSRTYVNQRSGERIMLSIAYGEDQRDGMQMHYPEICYPAQGFQLLSNRKGNMRLLNENIPVRRLETVAGSQRFEPVSYWTVIGEHATFGGIDKKLTEMRYSLRGKIPDGLLFRVSSISRDSAAAFALQESFAAALVTQLPASLRPRMAGLKALQVSP